MRYILSPNKLFHEARTILLVIWMAIENDKTPIFFIHLSKQQNKNAQKKKKPGSKKEKTTATTTTMKKK